MDDTRKAPKDLTVDEAPLDDYQGTVPDHVAIIMDGNGRWAHRRDMPRIRGHRAGADSVRSIVEASRYLGLDVLTLYAFSSENWNRPDDEVTGLMTLFDVYIDKERQRLVDNEIRLQVIGNRTKLPEALDESIAELEEETAEFGQMLLQVAVSYGAREEILQATRRIAAEARDGTVDPGELDESQFREYLYTEGQPDPDLLIRTSGEKRLSNFLLWQLAYSEFCFVETLWPDFDEHEFVDVLRTFDDRERRFGKTAEQLET